MGLFDAFKKKDCEICGKEVGLFGYKKLEDGEICKDCPPGSRNAAIPPWIRSSSSLVTGKRTERR